MKIVHFIWSLGTGGAETMLVDIVNRQAATEDVVLVIGNDVADSAVLGTVSPRLRVVHLKREPGSKNPLWILRLNLSLRAIRPDILHCHNPSAINALPFITCPKVVTIHNTRLHPGAPLRKFHRVFAISKAVKAEAECAFIGIEPVVVHNGIDFNAVKQRTDQGPSTFRIVQLSRLSHETKGQDILLKAIVALKYEYGVSNISVDFIGEGASRSYLSHLAETLGISSCVSFRGSLPREKVYEQLCGYSLLVQPSRWEGFGLTVAEGIAACIPVLVSNVEGPMEIIDAVGGGYWFRSGDADHCAHMIKEIMEREKRPGFQTDLSEKRARAEGKFDVCRTATRYIEEYGKILCRATQRIGGTR